MKPVAYRHLFGPVPSRRFGLSLGVDMVPIKTCTLDCLFCEVGATTALVIERREYAPLVELLAELRSWVAAGGKTDFITVAGSGEPTLHIGFGDVLAFIGQETRFRSALLTNSTLLHLPEVRKGAAKAHVVKATLSAWDEQSFRALHMPHPEATFARLLDGLRAFRAEYSGELWIEVFLVSGINASARNVERIARLVNPLTPARVHLNTVIRPPAHIGATACSFEEMQAFAGFFTPKAEVSSPFRNHKPASKELGREAVLAMLRRRPCTEADLVNLAGLNANEASGILKELETDGLARSESQGAERYYSCV